MADGSSDIQELTAAEFATDFVAGLLGGSAGLIVGHPFDTVKVILQTSKTKLPASVCVRMIIRQEGPRGLFKGMSYPLASVGFLNSLFFGLNMITESLIGGSSANRYSDIFLAGAIAGGIQAVPCTPVELVKVKLQTQLDISSKNGGKAPKYSGPWQCLHHTYSQYGSRGCFRGISATMARDISGFSVYMTVYKYFCDLGTPDGQVYPSFHTMLVAGGTAGVVSWALNFPIDTVKSLLQRDSLSRPQYSSTLDCVRQTYRQQGVCVFYKGFGPALARAFPLNAVTLCTYDWTQQQLKAALKDYGSATPPPGTTIREVQCHMQES